MAVEAALAAQDVVDERPEIVAESHVGRRHADSEGISTTALGHVCEANVMTGDQLINRLQAGQFLRIRDGVHRVHRVFLDPATGEPRICRPSMLDKGAPDGREWVPATDDEFAAHPCTVCR